ncbi:MAG: PTS sugar transporter subunit IIA [Candidatus Firestonebacteria bacterium]
MIGIVIVTHGELAATLAKTVELVIGEQESLEPVCLNAFEGLEDLKAKVDGAIKAAGKNSDGRVLVFTDMFGGSTTNVSLQFLSEKVEILAGVNLPMLLEALLLRNGIESSHALAKDVSEKAKKSIIPLSEMHKPWQ